MSDEQSDTASRATDEPAEDSPLNGSGQAFDRARQDPSDEANWDAVDEHAAATDSPEQVQALYKEVLSRSDLSADVLQLVGQRAVDFFEEWYEDPSNAIGVLRQLITRDYSNSWALEKLSLLLTLSERWDDLLGIYDDALANIEEQDQRAHLLEEAARIAKDFAGQAQRASDYLKQLFLLKPEDDKLASSLERRLEQQERHLDLIEVWSARLGAVSKEDGLPLRVSIAERYLEFVKDAARALETVEQILETEIGEAEACQLLERIAEHEASEFATKRQALETLKQRYAKAERLEDVIRVLDLALQVAQNAASDAADQVGLFQQLVEWLILADRPLDAQHRAAAWLQLVPTDSDALKQLRELSRDTKDFAHFASALVAASDVVADADLRVRLLLEAAQTQQEQADDAQAATELYARVLLDQDSSEETKLFSARRLTDLLTSSAQAGQRLDVLEKLSVLEPDPDKQRSVLGEAAELAESLGDDERALRFWDECLKKDAADKPALDSKVKILSRIENWPPLLATLRARFEHSKDDDERRSDLVWTAQIFEQRLSDLGEAIRTWREIEEVFARNDQTVDALTSLYLRAERWDDVVKLLSTVEASEEDDVRRGNHLATLGDTYREHKAQPAEAVVQYQKALELDPSFERARTGLVALLEIPECRHPAAETLASAYKAADEWENWLGLVETRFEVEPDVEKKQGILLEAAELVEKRAENQSRALEFVQRAFSIAPGAPVEERMLRLAGEIDGWSAAVEGYQRALRHCADHSRTTELLFEQGKLLETQLSDFNEALAAYKQIIEIDRSHIPGACAVVRAAGNTDAWDQAAWAVLESARAHETLAQEVAESFASVTNQRQAWDAALAALGSAIEAAQDLHPKTSHDLKFQLGTWHRDERQDAEAATRVLSEAVDEHRAVDSLTMLASLLRAQPSRSLVDALLKLADVDEDALPHLDEAAHVALEVVADNGLARPILERALSLSEARIAKKADEETRGIAAWCLNQLVHVATEASDYGDAFALLTRGASMNFDDALLRELKHRAAELAAHHLGQAKQAIKLCREVLDEDPERTPTINLLAQLYESEGELDELLSLRKAELALDPPLERTLELRLELARVLGALGRDLDDRVRALTANLQQLPGHPESIDALAEILAPAERFSELYEMLCEQAQLVAAQADGIAAARLFARAGLLAEQTLEDVTRALSAYRESVALDPDVEVLDGLASIHTAREEHSEAVEWLKQRLELTPPAQESARRSTLVRLGTALQQADAEEDAIKYLEQGLVDDPAALEVRQLLAKLREEREEWQQFADLLSEGVPFTSEPQAKVEFLSRSAEVRWHELNDLEGAIPLLQKARELDDGNRDLRLTLADALRNAERFDEARELLDTLLNEFGRRRTPERATVHFQLALIARGEGNLDEALTQLDAAAKIQRSEPIILKTLGDVARQKGELERAERAYRALLLLAGRNQQGGIGESAILFELYRIAAERDDQERAKDLLDSALEAADQDPAEALRLEDALREAEQWVLLLSALERRTARAETPAEKRDVLIARASVLVHLERLEEALELRLELLNADPHDAELLDHTAELAEKCGKRDRFFETLLALAEQAAEEDAVLACELWLRTGADAEQNGDLRTAANLYERAQATGARPDETFEALKRVHEQAGDVHGLQLALERFVSAPEDQVDGSKLTEALYRLAELELCTKDTSDTGGERLRRALEREPRWELGVSILETAMELVPPTPDTLDLLEQCARRVEDKQVLLRALAKITQQPGTTLTQLREAVSLAQELDNATQLEALLRRTVQHAREEGSLDQVLWAAVRLAEQEQAAGKHQAAFELLGEATAAADELEQFDLELKMAEIARSGLGDMAKAAEVYERLAEKEPSDARAWKPLLEVYRQTGQLDKLEGILARAEEHVVHASERRALQLERVRLLIDAGRLEDAESSLKRALEEEPDHEEASELLIELLTNQGRAEEVRDLMYKRMDAAIERGDQDATVNYALKLGEVVERDDMDAALAVYRNARSAVPGNKEILSALLRLVPEEEHYERASLMESLVPAEDPRAAENLALELMNLRQGMDDEGGMERALELGFKANPTSETLRQQLEQWYRSREQYMPLAEMLTVDAENRSEPDVAIARFMEAASLYDEQLGDAAMAAEVVRKAQKLAPLSPQVLEPLSRYLLQSAQPEEAMACLTEALQNDSLDDSRRGLILHLRAAVRARTDEHSLEAISDAIRDLDIAKGLGAEAVEEDLITLLDRQRELAEGEEEAQTERSAILRLSQLLPTIDETQRGLELLQAWSQKSPEDSEAVSIWGQLAMKAENWDSAAEAYHHLFGIAAGGRKRDAALHFAEACEKAGNPMDAREVLEQVNQETPGDESVRTRLRQMYEAAGAHKELAGLLLAEADNESDKERRYELLTDAGNMLIRSNEANPDAVKAFEQALKLKARDHRATVGLSRAYTLAGDIPQACKILESAIKSHGKKRSPELSELQHAMAMIAQAAGDEDGRFAWLDAALQSDRKNGVVAAEMAVFAMDRGEFDAAIKALQLVTLLKEECPMSRAEAYLRQGIIAQQRGDKKKAALLGKRALTADADYEPAKEFLEQLG